MKFDVTVTRDNVQISWNGFNDALVNFIMETLTRIGVFNGLECRDLFSQAKEQIEKEWTNHYLDQTFRLAHRSINTVLYDGDYEKSYLNRRLAAFTYEEFDQMR